MPETKPLPLQSAWLRASIKAPAVGVDRAVNVLRGYVVAQQGPFKSEGRGEFDRDGLAAIVRLMNANRSGLKSRLSHPTMSNDGIGKFLGRARDARLDTAVNAEGQRVAAVRADLHFDQTALDEPVGGGKPLGQYVMDLAESDPDALSSSLVLQAEEKLRLDSKGVPLEDENGERLPPLWFPTKLHASDIVDTGDAVDGILSAGDLAKAMSVGLTPELQGALRFDNVARLGSQLLDGMFMGQPREVIEARCRSWLERYLQFRFGPEDEPPVTPRLDQYRDRLDAAHLTLKKLSG